MKISISFSHSNKSYEKIIRWVKLVIISGGSQIIVQAISFLSGIIIIRFLSTKEYAFYTLANTILATMIILADSGITTGVMALGAKVWHDPEKLGSVLVTGLQLRKKFAIGSFIVSTPVLALLLKHHDANWIVVIVILLSLVPVFFATLSGNLLQIPPRLLQDIKPLQKNQIEANGGRLLMLALTILVMPKAFVAVLSSGIPQIWSNKRLRKISEEYVDWNQKFSVEIEKSLLAFIRKILPSSIYVCFSGQITLWLISIFGSTSAVAQVGALARLSVIFTIFSVLFSTIISPRFATMKFDLSLLLKRYLQIQLGLFILSVVIIIFTVFFSTEILWILGNEYTTLNTELSLTVLSGCVSLITGSTVMLYSSRGWVLNPVISISISIMSIILAIKLVDLNTIEGILKLNLIVVIVNMLINNIYFLYKIYSKNSNHLL